MAFLDSILQTADMLKSDIERKRQARQQMQLRQQQFMAGLQRQQMQSDAAKERQQMQSDAAQKRQAVQQKFTAKNSILSSLANDKTLDPASRAEARKAMIGMVSDPNAEVPNISAQQEMIDLPPEVADALKVKSLPTTKYKLVMDQYNKLRDQEAKEKLDQSTIARNKAFAERYKTQSQKKANPGSYLQQLANEAGQGMTSEQRAQDATYQEYMNKIINPEMRAARSGANPDSLMNVAKNLPTYQQYVGQKSKQAAVNATADSLANAIKDFTEKLNKAK